MNMNDPQNWQAFAAVIGAAALIIGSLLKVQSSVLAQLEAIRLQSEAGRSKVYDRIEAMGKEFRDGFITKLEHSADMKLVGHSIDELSRQQIAILKRIEHQCQIVRARRGDVVVDDDE